MWSHPNPLFEDDELKSLSETVTFTPSGPVTGYTVSVAPTPTVFSATASAGGIVVANNGSNLTGIYNISSIKYIDANGVEQTVTDWANVPAGANVVEFKPDPAKETKYVVSCVCNWMTTSVPPVPMVATIALDVTIFQQYDANKAVLKEKVSEGGGGGSPASTHVCLTTGHETHAPTASTEGSDFVTINGEPVLHVGHAFVVHVQPGPVPDPHAPEISEGSSFVTIDGKAMSRIGDGLDCGDALAEGNSFVMVGD